MAWLSRGGTAADGEDEEGQAADLQSPVEGDDETEEGRVADPPFGKR